MNKESAPASPRPRTRISGRVLLWGTALGSAILLFLRYGALPLLLGDYSWEINGQATLLVDAVRETGGPALVCVGSGGPLKESGVYAYPLESFKGQREFYVICRVPQRDIVVPYTVEVLGTVMPRNMHAYVWLETHSELASVCQDMKGDAAFVLASKVSDELQLVNRTPCEPPEPGASLGFAIAFSGSRRYFGSLPETRNIRVIPNGYQTKNQQ